MSTTTQKRVPLVPPDEKFWQRYSPHHEFPLASMTSFFVHGIIYGVLVLAGVLYMMRRESDTYKPPSLDVCVLQGGGGDEGKGAEPGLPGDSQPMNDVVSAPVSRAVDTATDTPIQFKEAPKLDIAIPEVGTTEVKDDLENQLAKVEQEASNQAKKEAAPKPPKIAMPGTRNPTGQGGLGGSGGGLGKGTKGTGLGPAGGPGGRPATKAEIYAWRWRFDLTGGGKEHVEKYLAMGVTVAVLAPDGKYLFLGDLRRRPVERTPGNIAKFKDAVMWQNTKLESLVALSKELQLGFVPQQVIMLLPREREERMAAAELEYAQKTGRPPQQIQATWFDFRLRDGAYEPVVLTQQ